MSVRCHFIWFDDRISQEKKELLSPLFSLFILIFRFFFLHNFFDCNNWFFSTNLFLSRTALCRFFYFSVVRFDLNDTHENTIISSLIFYSFADLSSDRFSTTNHLSPDIIYSSDVDKEMSNKILIIDFNSIFFFAAISIFVWSRFSFVLHQRITRLINVCQTEILVFFWFSLVFFAKK